MTKNDLIQSVSKSSGIDKTTVAKVIDSTFSSVIENVNNGESIYLRGFGTFKQVTRKAKTARDIGRGTTIQLPERKEPVFKFSKRPAY